MERKDDIEVVEAFTEDKNYQYGGDNPDQRSIRNVTGNEINGGRCDFGRDDSCVCPGLVCKPDGSIYACGCEGAPCFGNINNGELNIPDEWDTMECYREQITISV